VEFDDQRITQAMLNLAHNAVRHTEIGDEIGIGVDWRAGRSVMWVRDTGPGIDPAILDQLFTRHVRSASSRTSGGSGIGLSIVDAIAVAHGGRVTATTTSGEGAMFTIEFPAGVTTDEKEPA
jgi:signal transduction histidine kinase